VGIMAANTEGQNLIFLISQPRAGSTMTQRILGCHPDIHTVSEPWIMLSPLYHLRFNNIEAEYDTKIFKKAFQTFFEGFPNQYEIYYNGLRYMYSYIYDCALKNTNKKFFLDKTPRYYYIIPELLKTFPESRFIILLRNPLAVLCSIVRTWIKNDWNKLNIFKSDLIKAPFLLMEGIQKLGDRCLVLHYENLITNPEKEIKKICQSMELVFSSEIIKYGTKNITKWTFGDQDLVYKKTKPEPQNLEQWILHLNNPQIWQLANDYLEFLGSDTIYQMGYSYMKLRSILDDRQPLEANSSKIFSVDWLQKNNQASQVPKTTSDYIAIAGTEKRKGRLAEAAAAYRRAIKLNANLPWLYSDLADILLKLDNLDEAIFNYRKAIKLNPDSAWLYYQLAKALVKQTNIDEAAASYQKAIALNPNKIIIQRKLKELYK
jgi:tetratricopeptide (TPR) repeat protein